MLGTKQAAFTLLETLISAVIGAMLCILCLHFLFTTMQTYYKIQQKFKIQHSQLLAKHYIRHDIFAQSHGIATCNASDAACSHLIPTDIVKLINNKSIKPQTDLLAIYNLEGGVVYYLRKSVVTAHSYALYRDDIAHNAQALIEDITDFKVQIIALEFFVYKVVTTIVFTNTQSLEIICILNTPS